jgi:acetyl-CoA carboxylase biotin carboxylase subunit
MLAKLIVWAPTRDEAVARMHRALLELTVHGVETSRDFHLRVMEHDEFRRGEIEIQWLEQRLPTLVATTPTDDEVRTAAIAAAMLAVRDRTGRSPAPSNGRADNRSGDAHAANGAPDAGDAAGATATADAWKLAARREAIGDR